MFSWDGTQFRIKADVRLFCALRLNGFSFFVDEDDDGSYYVTLQYRVDWGESASWLQRVAGGQSKHGFELVEIIGQALNTKWSAMSVAEKKQKKEPKNTWEGACNGVTLYLWSVCVCVRHESARFYARDRARGRWRDGEGWQMERERDVNGSWRRLILWRVLQRAAAGEKAASKRGIKIPLYCICLLLLFFTTNTEAFLPCAWFINC